MKQFLKIEEKESCKSCLKYKYDYGMMGFEDEEFCSHFKSGINFNKIDSSRFFCSDHSSIKKFNLIIRKKEDTKSRPRTGFYIKENF